MAICKDCGGELQDSRYRGASTRVNKDGRCPICAEIWAEAQADDEETIAEAKRILARRAAR